MTQTILDDLKTLVFGPYPDISVSYVFNVGVHEYPKHLYDSLKQMFHFSKLLLKLGNGTHRFLYREISSQHYNLTNHNPHGYYHSKTIKKSRSLQRNLSCVPLQSHASSRGADPRHVIERTATRETGIETIPFRDLSGHYFDLKHGGGFFSHHIHPRGKDDCTHLLPVAATTAYRVLWLHTLLQGLAAE